jgi:hypothetical protein
MMKQIIGYIRKQVESKRDLALLQATYLTIGVLAVVVCGLVGLFNQSLGVGMLIFPLVVVVALCMNTVAWALIRLGIEALGIKAPEVKATEKKAPARKK